MSRLKRFQHLESPRSERPGEGPRSTEGRFNRMEPERAPGTPSPPPPQGAAAERFQRQVSEPPLALDTRDQGEQLFIRCMRCEADNSRYAQECTRCGASFQTAEQRAFNETFWQRRQAEVAVEAEAVARFHDHREQEAEIQRRQREAVQAQAFEMMKAEGRGGFREGSSHLPPGVRLLRAIENPTGQLAAIAGFALLGILCVLGIWKAQPNGAFHYLSFGGVLVLVFCFTPPSWWRHRRRRWWHGGDDYF